MTEMISLCADEIRRQDHDQYLCGLFAEESQIAPFFALHLFYLETARIRDVVNEPHLGLIRLQWWRDLVNDPAGSDHQGTHHEIAKTLTQAKIDSGLFEQYFNARSFDMEDQPHDDLEALIRYCEATGGAFARMKAQALRINDDDAISNIGAADALCRILKTLPFQAKSGRCRIPRNVRTDTKLDIKSFGQLQHTEGLRECVKILSDSAAQLIEEARTQKVDSNVLLLNSVCLDDYLSRLRKVDYNPFDPNIGSSPLKRQIRLWYHAWRKTY